MDWKELITELESSGLTQREIADFAGCSQPYVSQLKKGARTKPEYGIGLCLIQLQKNVKRGKQKAKAA